MPKQLNVILDDEDHTALKKTKGERSWRDFIMTLVKKMKIELATVGVIAGFIIDVVMGAATLSYGPPASPFAAFMRWPTINMTYYGLFFWLGILGYAVGSFLESEPKRTKSRKRAAA
jgi:hypothetical protein